MPITSSFVIATATRARTLKRVGTLVSGAALAGAALTLPAAPAHAAAVDCTVNGEQVAMSGNSVVQGTTGDDVIECWGLWGVTIWGGEGDDTVRLKGGIVSSTIDTGEGNDKVYIERQPVGSTVSWYHLGSGDDYLSYDTYAFYGEIYGGSGADRIEMPHGDNFGLIDGGYGNDVVFDGAGVNHGEVYGGGGDDTITPTENALGLIDCGAGNDIGKADDGKGRFKDCENA